MTTFIYFGCRATDCRGYWTRWQNSSRNTSQRKRKDCCLICPKDWRCALQMLSLGFDLLLI